MTSGYGQAIVQVMLWVYTGEIPRTTIAQWGIDRASMTIVQCYSVFQIDEI